MSVWFTSDTHFGHTNFCHGTTTWEDKGPCRPFSTPDEMDRVLIDNLNDCVETGDTLYHLGDFCFRSYKLVDHYRSLINCKNVHLIMGNHGNKKYLKRTDLFLSVSDIKEIKVEGQRIILCHYAMRVWNKAHYGAWHLYGHSHSNLPEDPNARSMDVGVDTNGFMPYSFDVVKSRLDVKPFAAVDHHQEVVIE